MNRTCVDCSVFDPNQGMDAHPVFRTDEEWADHLRRAHGRITAASIPDASPVIGGAKPLKPPDMQREWEAALEEAYKAFQDLRLEVTARLDTMLMEVNDAKAAVRELQAQVGGQAAINEDLTRRLVILETLPERLKPTT